MSNPRQPWLQELTTVLSAPTVVLSSASGQIRAGGAQGVLHADTRVLSVAVLEVGAVEPEPVSGGLTGPGTAVFVASPRALGDDLPDPTVWVERERSVSAGLVRERIWLVSAAGVPVTSEVTLRVGGDLATIAAIKSGCDPGGPVPVTILPGPDETTLIWGDGRVEVRLSAPGATASAAAAGEVVLRWPVSIAGRGRREVGWQLTVSDPAAVVTGVAAGAGDGGGGRREDPWAGVRAGADDPRLPLLLRQSLADAAALRMSAARTPREVFLAAGAPWYFTLFGRDSIWAARLLLPFGWELAAGTLRTLAAFQGRRRDPETAEAPGKIPHELRAATTAGGLPPLYYGTIDATPLWICLLHDAWRWGMPQAQVRALLPVLKAALAYLREDGDADGDGFLEYLDESGHGLANQGWKDSGDAVRFASGRIASPPVTLCEVQGYAFEAAMGGAGLLDALGEPGAEEWRGWAAKLASAFRASFWVDGRSGPYPALALDAAKRQVDSLTSNIGHLLGTGLLTAQEEGLVAAALSGPDMNSGFGLRTMSSASGGYSPLSYHCGSVWTHDTAIVIRGLARSGHGEAAASLADGLLEAAAGFGWRLPELFSGDARAQRPWPSPYPASCRPQAWAAASAGALVQALLGLDADVPAGQVILAPPSRPPGRGGPRLHIDGLVAGNETFSAGIGPDGEAYVRDLNLTRTQR